MKNEMRSEVIYLFMHMLFFCLVLGRILLNCFELFQTLDRKAT